MSAPFVYCDYNAGAMLRPAARDALMEALQSPRNPSSIHAAGRRARALLEDAREAVARAVEAQAANVVFTSGATEAAHLALEAARPTARALILSAIEHEALFAHGPRVFDDVRIAPVNADGVIDLAALDAVLARTPAPALVALMLANNETGAIQPVAEAAALARQHGALLLVDAAQALGRVRVSLPDLDATYVIVSSHKVGGPPGAGALILAPGAPFAITRAGGGQEQGRRPGTENVPAIAGFGAACAYATAELDAESARLAALRDAFEAALPNEAVVFARNASRLCNTSLFALPGVRAETALIRLDLDGVCVSSGAACSSGKVRASRVLAAMGVEKAQAEGALRVSFGWASDEADARAAAGAVARLGRSALKGAA